ncbi:uncharacterized protein LOC123546328 [Mercenaria mercenaria]|uniref:uncharacterized protein LOC123546328 n=1 Tax=Mercenaria mercenaria TaxID=6596 RepID=UPI00234F84D5|nr:uncharacterized protein LOC123546328 [Mercenaria mercenaria]
MSSGRRPRKPDRDRYYREGYEDQSNGGSNVYPRSYAPWQWGYWTADNMAYNGYGDSYYSIQDDRGRGRRGHFAGNMYDNAGYHGYKHSAGGGSYKLKPPSSSDGFSEYPGESMRDKGTRRCCVVMAVVGLVFLVGAGLAIGIYFGIVDKPESLPPDATTTTAAPVPVLSVDMTLTIDQPFNTDLNDPSTDVYKSLKTQVENEIDTNMRNGPQGSSYISNEVQGFSEGSIIPYVALFFRNTIYSVGDEVFIISPENVKSELEAQLVTSNSQLFVRNSIAARNSSARGKLGLGESCSIPSDCSVADALCTGSPSVCQCVSGYFDSNGAIQKGVCLRKKAYGENCSIKTNCETIDSICDGTPQVCTCADGIYHNASDDACRRKLQQGEAGCVDAALQCLVSSAVCVSGKCDCETGYQLKNNTCKKLIDIDQSGCVTDTDCLTPNAVCALSDCKCVSGDYYATTTKTCENKKINGQACDDVSQCKSPGALCDTTCKCSNDKYLKGNTGCVPKVPYGGVCSEATNCLYENSGCILTLCQCPSTTYRNDADKSCKPKIEYGQACTSADQCATTDVECPEASKTCVCAATKYLDGDKCSDKKENGVSCNIAEECKLNNAECAGVCGCPAGTYAFGDSCLQQVAVGDACVGRPGECSTIDAECDGTPKTCNCPDNMFLNGDRCSEKTGAGEACENDVECSYSNSVCLSKLCSCAADRFVNNDDKSCDLKIEQGGTCTASNQCKKKNAECNTAKKCACPASRYEEGEECKDKIPYGGPCSTSSVCLTTDVECSGSTCMCGAGFYHDTNMDACFAKKDNGITCNNAEECKLDGAECVGSCGCPAGTYPNGASCSPQIAYGEECTGNSTAECFTPNAECDGTPKTCRCPATKYLNINKCSDKTGDGEACSTDEGCSWPYAICLSDQCTCPLDRFSNDATKTCDPKIEQGGDCTDSKHCKTKDAECNTASKCACPASTYEDGEECKNRKPYNGQCITASHCETRDAGCIGSMCKCDKGFYHDTGNDWCMAIKGFGEDCTSAMQCPTDAECNGGKCACLSDKFEDGDKCTNKKKNKEACDNAGQCLLGFAECVDICRCPADRFEYETMCEPKVGNGKTCTGKSPDECLITDAECDTTCECPESKFLNGDKCTDKTGDGQKCIQDIECGYNLAVCVSGFCACGPDRYVNNTKESCELKVGLNEKCETADMCKPDNAECNSENKCACPTKTYQEGEVCKDSKAYGVECDNVSQCATGSSICTGIPKKCTCNMGFYHDVDSDSCMAVGGFGDMCDSSDQCAMGVECIGKKCACPTGFYEDGAKCSEKKDSQVVCDSPVECKINGSVCNTVCQCPTGTYENGLNCDKQVAYEVACSVTAACLTKFSECSSATRTCLCPSTKFHDTDADICRDKTGNGEACKESTECSFKDAVCVSENCVCPEGKFGNTTQESCDLKKENGEDCTQADQCATKNAVCSADSKCGCLETAFEEEGECKDKKPNGGDCKTVEGCSVKNTQCISGVCNCADTDYQMGDECFAKKVNGMACGSNIECLYEGAVCDENCTCPTMYRLMETTCMQMIPYKSECSDVQLCTTTDAVCTGSQTDICTCEMGDYYDVDTDSCMIMLEQGDQGCEDAELQCKTAEAVCVDGACGCAQAAYYKDGMCHPGLDNGETCVSTNQCKITGAFCDAVCKCESDKYDNGTSCNPKVAYNMPCTQDSMCITSNGKCLIDTCGCRDNYFHEPSEDECLIKKPYNTMCNVASDCITGNADCIDNSCLCPTSKYLAAASCEDKKANGDICGSTEECGVVGSICDIIECRCPDDTYYDVSCKPKVGLNEPCSNASHCLFTNAECHVDKCACPHRYYPSGTSCLPVIAFGSPCNANEECGTSTCFNNLCGCLATHYYEASTETCLTKVEYAGDCNETGQCDTKNAECSIQSCLCPEDRFFDNNACLIKLGDGENCTTDGQCSYSGSVCVSGSCTCPNGTFVDNFDQNCDQLKGPGEQCNGPDECAEGGLICDGTCRCPPDNYLSGTTCVYKKLNGAQCDNGTECLVPESDCINKTCQCPATKYLNSDVCVDRLGFGSDCTENGDCMEMLVCSTELMCSCQDGYMYDEDSSNCTMVITTTAMPTTMAPDEEIIVEAETELVSDETYDIALADNTSEIYLQKKAETEAAMMQQFANNSAVQTVEVIGFEEGSVKVILKVSFFKVELSVSIEVDNTEQLEEAQALVVKSMDVIIKTALPEVAKDLEQKGVFQGVKVPDVPIVVKQDPCIDEKLCVERAEKDICGPILKELQAATSNKDRCSAYLDLLSCVALQYELADTKCKWNRLRTNFEDSALKALNLNKTELKACVRGNFFNFVPIDNAVIIANPCGDLNVMKMVARYQCATLYSFISLARGRTDICRFVLQMEVCVRNILIQHFGPLYLSCETDANTDVSLTSLIDHEDEIFESRQVSLEKCEFCLAPNVFEVFTSKCGMTMEYMKWVSEEEACRMLHMEMQCIEAHLKMWDENHVCTMDDIKKMFKNDERFLNFGKKHLSWLDKDSWNQCLGTEMVKIGPPEPESVCYNQNYINYVLHYYGCLKIGEGEELSCNPYYRATECVRRIMKKENMDCGYKEIEKSILDTSTEYNTISTSIAADGSLKPCIIEAGENACQSSLMFSMYTYAQYIIGTCLYNVNNILYLQDLQDIKPYGNAKGSFSCRIYAQAMACVHGLFAAEKEVCDLDQFRTYIDDGLPGLIQVMIDYSGVDPPPNDVSIYKGCADEIEFDDLDCKGDSVVIHSVTAACAVHVKSAVTLDQKCGAFSACIDGTKKWHEENNLCPGYVDALEKGKMNSDFAYYFWEVSNLNWMTCFEEEIEYILVLWFPNDDYSTDFSDVNSEASKIYIESKSELLNFLLIGRRFYVEEIFTNTRVKRQAQGNTRGTRIRIGFSGPKDFEQQYEQQFRRLPASARRDVKHLSFSINDGSRLGYCPVQEAYMKKVCEGFRDQCSKDDDCDGADEKCCSDGSASFCVDSVTEPAQYMVMFRLVDEKWDDDYSSTDNPDTKNLMNRYESEFRDIFSDVESYSSPTFSKPNGEDGVALMFTVEAFSNPAEVMDLDHSGITLEDVFFQSQPIDERDRCPDSLLLIDHMVTCVEEGLTDKGFPYQDYQVCSAISQLVRCASEKCRKEGPYDDCEDYSIREKLKNEKSAILDKINMDSFEHSTWRISTMLRSYDGSRCQNASDYDIDPCYDNRVIKEAMGKCSDKLSTVDDNNPLDEQFCSIFTEFSSCVLVKLRDQGSRWCDISSMDILLDHLKDQPYNYVISQREYHEHCDDHYPKVCTFIGLRTLTWAECKLRPYIYEGSCSNITEKEVLTNFVACARIEALKRKEECEVDKIVEIIGTDRYKLGILFQDEDIEDCIPEDTFYSIKAQLASSADICSSERAINLFYDDCFSEDCLLNLDAIAEDTTRCTLLYQQVACVQRNMKNQTFECEFEQLMNSTGTILDVSFPLFLTEEQYNPCKEKMSDSSMKKCGIPILSRMNGSMECVEHLLKNLSHFGQDQQCKLVSLGGSCLNAVTTEVDATCDTDEIAAALRRIIAASSVAMRQLECEYEPTPAKAYPNCEGRL